MNPTNFFVQKSEDFDEREIFSLPRCWQQIIDTNAAYANCIFEVKKSKESFQNNRKNFLVKPIIFHVSSESLILN